MRRKDREMPASFGLELADKCLYGIVALTDENGLPYAVALSLVRSGRSLYFHCAMEGKKTDSLRKNPRVCVSFVSGVETVEEKFTTRFQSAIMRGTAAEVCEKEEKIRALRLLCEKLAPENMDSFDGAIERSLQRTAVWRIDIEEITAKEKK